MELMSNGDWVAQRIASAKADRPLVTQAVLARIEELLRGQLSEGEVSRRDLTTIAKDLLAKMASVPPEAEVSQ
jgi:hypothetical protein